VQSPAGDGTDLRGGHGEYATGMFQESLGHGKTPSDDRRGEGCAESEPARRRDGSFPQASGRDDDAEIYCKMYLNFDTGVRCRIADTYDVCSLEVFLHECAIQICI